MLFLLLSVVASSVCGIGFGIFLDEYHPPLFNPHELHAIAQAAVRGGLTADEAFVNITAELKHRYPGHIADLHSPIFINAGGFMGSFTLIHASLSEYILFFGSALGTTGHSGRYWGDIYDFLLTGEFWQWNEGTYKKIVYKPGDMIVHHKWAATAIKIKEGSWMLEYAQGVIPSMMPFAFGDTISSTQDMWTLLKSLRIYASLVTASLLKGKL